LWGNNVCAYFQMILDSFIFKTFNIWVPHEKHISVYLSFNEHGMFVVVDFWLFVRCKSTRQSTSQGDSLYRYGPSVGNTSGMYRYM
jgi:hypothetical protein